MDGDVLLSDTTFYRIRPGQPVFMTITVGDGNPGGTALRLNGVSIPVNAGGETQIGPAGLPGVLQCVTTVKDVNPATNNTSVTHSLRGGAADAVFPYAVSVKADKGLARYFITFVLNA